MHRLLAISLALPVAIAAALPGVAHANHHSEASAYRGGEVRGLPDPFQPALRLIPATASQIDAAMALNASLDLWRICSWTGHEASAAVFNTWTRTHSVGDPLAPTSSRGIPAWKSFGVISASRTSLPDTGFNTAPGRCDVTRATRARLQAEMERQAVDINSG